MSPPIRPFIPAAPDATTAQSTRERFVNDLYDHMQQQLNQAHAQQRMDSLTARVPFKAQWDDPLVQIARTAVGTMFRTPRDFRAQLQTATRGLNMGRILPQPQQTAYDAQQPDWLDRALAPAGRLGDRLSAGVPALRSLVASLLAPGPHGFGLAGGGLVGMGEGGEAPRDLALDAEANAAPMEPNPATQMGSGRYYSRVERAVTDAKITKAPGRDWLAYLTKQPMAREEFDYTLRPYLEAHADEPLTREQVAQAHRDNQFQLEETRYGTGFRTARGDALPDEPGESDADMPARYGIYDEHGNLLNDEDLHDSNEGAQERADDLNRDWLDENSYHHVVEETQPQDNAYEDYSVAPLQRNTRIHVERGPRTDHQLNLKGGLDETERFRLTDDDSGDDYGLFASRQEAEDHADQLEPQWEIQDYNGERHGSDYYNSKAEAQSALNDLEPPDEDVWNIYRGNGHGSELMSTHYDEQDANEAAERANENAWDDAPYHTREINPGDDDYPEEITATGRNQNATHFSGHKEDGGTNYREIALQLGDNGDWAPYTGGHLPAPRQFLHLRMSDHVGPDGKKYLLIEEMQSDRHQQARAMRGGATARRGYAMRPIDQVRENETYQPQERALRERVEGLRNNYAPHAEIDQASREYSEFRDAHDARVNDGGVPDAPFKKTEDWAGLAWRRAMDEAAAGDYDRVAWVSGTRHNERYSVTRAADELRYEPTTGRFRAFKNGNAVHEADIQPDEIPAYIGNGPTKALLATPVPPRGYWRSGQRAPLTELGEPIVSQFYHPKFSRRQPFARIVDMDPEKGPHGDSYRHRIDIFNPDGTGHHSHGAMERRSAVVRVERLAEQFGGGEHILKGQALVASGDDLRPFYDVGVPKYVAEWAKRNKLGDVPIQTHEAPMAQPHPDAVPTGQPIDRKRLFVDEAGDGFDVWDQQTQDHMFVPAGGWVVTKSDAVRVAEQSWTPQVRGTFTPPLNPVTGSLDPHGKFEPTRYIDVTPFMRARLRARGQNLMNLAPLAGGAALGAMMAAQRKRREQQQTR